MTEQEWLACTDLELMLLFLGNRTSGRKNQLTMIACARRVPAHLYCPEIEGAMRHAILLAEGQGSGQIAVSFRSIIKPLSDNTAVIGTVERT
jgi:hypothetical protein